MTMYNRPFNRLSDLVVHEYDPSVGYTRDVITLNFVAAGAVPMGTAVYRAKGVDDSADWAKVTANSQLVATNEFAIVFGDGYGAKETFDVLITTDTKAVAFRRGPVILKDYLVKSLAVAAGLTAPQFETLRKLLKDQGVIVEITV